MAKRALLSYLHQNVPMCSRSMSLVAEIAHKTGNRDVVGHGWNGEEAYLDRADFPMPSIRFKANTPSVLALRQKEKGDWKKLSIAEKKELYRISFRQTFSEFQAPTGEWKGAIGCTLMGVTLSLWMYMFLRTYAYPPLPESFSEESRLAQLERMKVLQMNPISGISAEK